MNNFETVRDNVRRHSQGVFRLPHTAKSLPASSDSKLAELPFRADFARLTRSYQSSFHGWYPIIHWPTFQDEADQVYTERSFSRMPREWIGLFFAVLACGTLGQYQSHTADDIMQRGPSYFDIATQALTPWPTRVTVTHAQTSLLLSIFAQETNMGSVGEMWLNSAISAAQGADVYIDSGTGSVIDIEVRRRLWWALYVRDR